MELEREAAWKSRTGKIGTCLSPQGITEQTCWGWGPAQEARLGRGWARRPPVPGNQPCSRCTVSSSRRQLFKL